VLHQFLCLLQKSFDAVKFWLNELKQRAASDIIIAVVANKVDLPSREVPAEVGFLARFQLTSLDV
jgi:GTPase SAR1 family protein